MRPRLSVIIPTCGRPTLKRTLESLPVAGFTSLDEALVVSDGHQPLSMSIALAYQGVKYVEEKQTRDVGAFQRNSGMDIAIGTHLLFMDDDDEYTEGSLDRVRCDLKKNPDRIHVYKMVRWDGVVTWSSKDIFYGNIGTPMFVIPNKRGLLPRWSSNGGHDFQFLKDISGVIHGGEGEIVWHDFVICRLRPHIGR